MKERPILFSSPMVRALLDGSKTQTRRVIKGAALDWISTPNGFNPQFIADAENRLCPYGQIGDRLWVRETFYKEFSRAPKDDEERLDWVESGYLAYRASDEQPYGSGGWLPWKPSIHMPRWASRITMEVVSVRVERLQDISEADCIAEGCAGGHGSIPGYGYAATPLEHYNWLWNSINGPGAWEKNPWVWVVEFKKVEP